MVELILRLLTPGVKPWSLVVDILPWFLVVIEFIAIGYIITELRALKRHHGALLQFQEHLEQVRPFLSTLLTKPEEIMVSAVTFTQKSQQILALGSIGSLKETERKPNESDLNYKKRLNDVDKHRKDYVKATEDFILTGDGERRYCRIINFIPENDSDRAIFEIVSNVNFFLRLMKQGEVRSLNLELYHNPTILKGRGDLHFRCSENQVILRVGGPENRRVNVAIVNTDSRVVSAFKRYYQSIIDSDLTRKVELHHLQQLKLLLENKDLKGIRDYLGKISKD